MSRIKLSQQRGFVIYIYIYIYIYVCVCVCVCIYIYIYIYTHTYMGDGARGDVVVKVLRYKPAGRRFDSRWYHCNFSVT